MFYLDRPHTRYTFEPITGCSHGCSYCNAFSGTNEIKTFNEWITPKIHDFGYNEVIEEFKKLDKSFPKMMDFIFICSTSDPFQKSLNTELLVEKSIDVLNNYIGICTRLLSKGTIPRWLSNYPKNSVGITIDNIDRYRKAKKNIETLKYLSQSKIYTSVSFQPFDVTTSLTQFRELLETFKFVNQFTFGVMDDATPREIKRGFLFSDISADFALKNKINYFNGSPRFNHISKQRLLKKYNVKRPIWFGDHIDTVKREGAISVCEGHASINTSRKCTNCGAPTILCDGGHEICSLSSCKYYNKTLVSDGKQRRRTA